MPKGSFDSPAGNPSKLSNTDAMDVGQAPRGGKAVKFNSPAEIAKCQYGTVTPDFTDPGGGFGIDVPKGKKVKFETPNSNM